MLKYNLICLYLYFNVVVIKLAVIFLNVSLYEDLIINYYSFHELVVDYCFSFSYDVNFHVIVHINVQFNASFVNVFDYHYCYYVMVSFHLHGKVQNLY
jgi:hypothetical protein